MKKFLIAGSSLAAVAAAGSAGAVDVTLGGSIDMGVEFGLGKNKGNFAFGTAYANIGLSLAAAGTTDGGMKYGGSFSLSTIDEMEVNMYENGDYKALLKFTQDEASNIVGKAYNLSGGAAITKNNIVSVKINSDWQGVGGTITSYGLNYTKLADQADICKIAGRLASGTVGVTRDGAAVAAAAGAYLPAGKVTKASSGVLTAAGAISGSAGFVQLKSLAKSDGNNVTVGQQATKWAKQVNSYTTKHAAFVSNGVVAIKVTAVNKTGSSIASKSLDAAAAAAIPDAAASESVLVFTTDGAGATTKVAPAAAVGLTGATLVLTNNTTAKAIVTGAQGNKADIYAGPFMEVKLASSTTKMVVGAVCLTKAGEFSESAAYIDVASNVVGAAGASIFVEGGFGKLTLQTGDYAGTVSAIGDAGDAAKISADGLVAVVEGVGLFGANPYLAVDLSGSINALEVMTGGTIDLGGMSLGVDAIVSTAGIGAWDIGGTYAMGDMNLGFAYDSSNDWGVSSSMNLAGFAVNAEFYSKTGGDHEKSGIYYNVGASTSMNGMGLEIGFDQDLKPELGVSYDMGNLNIYAGYDAADEGGKVGAKLSF